MNVVNDVLLNWKIFILVFSFISIISITNTKLPILPISSFNFIFTSISLWFLSMWITLVALHKLLKQNKPIDYVIRSGNIEQYQKATNDGSCRKKPVEIDPNRLKQLIDDIDRYFIMKWYVNISENEMFIEESKHVVADVVRKMVEVQSGIDKKNLLHCCLNIYLKHLKEFKKTVKRKEKYEAKVEELYRYSHSCISSRRTKKYYIHQLTNSLLSHFVNWELWNSLPCHILVSVLSRKLLLYILNLSSSPDFLNYLIFSSLANENIQMKHNLHKCNRIVIKDLSQFIDEAKENESDAKQSELKSNQKEIKPEVDFHRANRSALKEMPSHREQHTITKPVKIYEAKKSTTTKTWRDSQDLSCVSLGQDPLEILQTTPEQIKHFAKPSTTVFDGNNGKLDEFDDSPTNAANLILSEVKTSMEGLKSSIKPISDATVHTLNNFKDLQETTVNSALNKIGDFQDEAAGVMEGLLDFGRAGLRKGLRLTGLQDNIETAKPAIAKSTTKKKPAKLTRSESQEKTSSAESSDSVWINPLQFDSPSFDGHILLEKPKKAPDTEKGPLSQKSDADHSLIPLISTESENDSPDPEYEEPADLASTIAKLRSLLQQKSSESSLSTPALSPMPPEDFQQKLESQVADTIEIDGMVPSFYKFCAKTATGVLQNTINTLKTALPTANLTDSLQSTTEKWYFIQSEQKETDLINRVKKLVHERKDFCTVDTAYEAIDSLDSLQQSTDNLFGHDLPFEDELDDFEGKLPVTKALIDVLCELLSDSGSPFLQEPMIKAVMLILGPSIENFVISKVNWLSEDFSRNLFTIPESSDYKVLTIDIETFVDGILTSLPDSVKLLIGNEALRKALTLFINSYQVQKINQDVLLQIFDLLTMRLIDESTCLMSQIGRAHV